MSRKETEKREYRQHKRGALRLLLLLFLACLMLQGCGKKLPKAPELLDPAKGTVSFRPVTKRVVGYLRMLYGNVVPMEYPCYWEKNCEITSVKVGVGDYVKEGDVVAVADKEGLEDAIRESNFRISSLQRQREKTVKLYDQTFGLLNYKKDTEVYIEGNDLAQILKEEQIQQENLRYELAVIDAQIKSEQEQIRTKKEKLKSVTFTAPHSGYVTYVKDLTESNMVAGFENVVVIGDYNDLYIEVPETNIEKYQYGDYQSKWTEIDGKKVPIQEFDYEVGERAYAKAVVKNPYMRFKAPGAELVLGNKMALYFLDDSNEECLAVGNDSLYHEGLDAFVYVKKDEAGNTEKRKVEIGTADEYYTEVKSGLSEGELVLYSSNVYVPNKYTEYETVYRTYTEVVPLSSTMMARPYVDLYLASYDGRLERQDMGGVIVHPGDELFKIIMNGGKGELEAAAVAIDDLNTNHKLFLKEYEKSKKELDRALASLQENERMIGARDEMGPDAQELDVIRSGMNAEAEIRAQLNSLEIEREYEEKDYEASSAKLAVDYSRVKKQKGGSHEAIVKAANEGKAVASPVVSESPVRRGQFIMGVQRFDPAGKTKLYVYQSPADGYDPPARIGGSVVLKTEDKREFTGKCIAVNPGEKGKYYLFTKDGKEVITYSAPFKKNAWNQFYMEMDEQVEELWLAKSKLEYEAEHFDHVVAIPASGVYKETNKLSSNVKEYVWKLVDGKPVKEYVTTYETPRAKEYALILRGVSEGDIVLK
ncbi:MAG: hypothetical protein K6E18_07930 [Lachnospiraceae bacterium]|nr:hypothetical protein [Lachnospiraceae bacterium]